jgi:uncharacterized protein YbbC (DUF1343 family)
MPSFASALLYPGLCLFEATNVSVGRGTAEPFQQFGAPWMHGERVIDAMREGMPAGVSLEPCSFTPALAPWASEPCLGVRVTVTPGTAVRPVALGLRLLSAVACTHRTHFAWAPYPTAANPSGSGHFERLVGRPDLREQIDRGALEIGQELAASWTSAGDWATRVEPVLCYR